MTARREASDCGFANAPAADVLGCRAPSPPQVLPSGEEVKLQRNALEVLERPSGHEPVRDTFGALVCVDCGAGGGSLRGILGRLQYGTPTSPPLPPCFCRIFPRKRRRRHGVSSRQRRQRLQQRVATRMSLPSRMQRVRGAGVGGEG